MLSNVTKILLQKTLTIWKFYGQSMTASMIISLGEQRYDHEQIGLNKGK